MILWSLGTGGEHMHHGYGAGGNEKKERRQRKLI